MEHKLVVMKTDPAQIFNNFSVPKKDYTFKSITNGLINDTFLVLDDKQAVYILQRINANVFIDIKAVMQNIVTALPLLKSSSYSSISLVKTTKNNSYHTENGYWRVLSFIENSITYDTTTNSKTAFEAGKIISEFHKLLQDTEVESYKETIPNFHNLIDRNNQFFDALESAKKERLTEAKKVIRYAEKLLPDLLDFCFTELPIRVCHNDTKLNNILFSSTTGKALCLIDLDTLMKGYFYYDFGDAVRTIVNTANEDEKDVSKITFNKELFSSFVDGLSTNKDLLSTEEIASLPLGAVFMPFIHGLRALTDYLSNDTYYKVAYTNQNLDRCISLFDFSKKALENVDFMQEVIKKKFIS
ncbi:aminoglycoside phosphotransferase family protein [Cellulophaga sp. 20_2_10]|uniref:phosphotransferase enzyme family protein n=1 Tax=Cellulophaga sp. 20_2_10 TaxID=2942476 RepID=UPI00201A7FCE|nr:aminoglycoside phosphotransferase family protein [Cellulophaga sp. 20_2_10]MCL5247218.1 aminoglycoside phosphotransferase family protein [Cellulophaga sp. 20_2_10]